MNQYDSKIPLPGGLRQDFFQAMQLDGADAAHGQMRCTGLSRAHANYGNTAPDTQTGKDVVQIFCARAIIPRGVRQHILGPVGHGFMPVGIDVGVVVAGNDGNL